MLAGTLSRDPLSLKDCANIISNLLMSMREFSLVEDYDKHWSQFKSDQQYIVLLFFLLSSEESISVPGLNHNTIEWMSEKFTGEGLTQHILKLLLQGSCLGVEHWERLQQETVKYMSERSKKSNLKDVEKSEKRKRKDDCKPEPESEMEDLKLRPSSSKRKAKGIFKIK